MGKSARKRGESAAVEAENVAEEPSQVEEAEEQKEEVEEEPKVPLTTPGMLEGSAFETHHISYPHDPLLAKLVVERYEGDMENGLYHGRGKAYFTSGNRYEGDFDSGLLHGRGTFTWADGVMYTGTFVDNTMHGEGRFLWPDGSIYVGEVQRGLRHGYGTLILASGKVYKGQWHRSLRHGKGTLDYGNGQVYDGDWKENHPSGMGTMRYASGSVYQGEWKRGIKSGRGSMTWHEKNESYEGEWRNNTPHGHGTYTWIQTRIDGSQFVCRNRYCGQFEHGRRHGRGTYFFADGAILEGTWHYNLKHGTHIMTFCNGVRRELQFTEDRLTTAIDGECYATFIPRFDDLHGADNTFGNQQITNVVLQNMSLLRRIYHFYSKLAVPTAPDNVYLLKRFQLHQAFIDSQLERHNVCMADLQACLGDVSPPWRAAHREQDSLLPRHFLSMLVRASFYLYGRVFNDSAAVLADCFSKFLSEDLFPRACTIQGLALSSPIKQQTFQQHWNNLHDTFHALASSKGDPMSASVTIRKFLHTCRRNSVLGPYLTFEDVRSLLEDVHPIMRDQLDVKKRLSFLECAGLVLGMAERACVAFGQARAEEQAALEQEEAERRARLSKDDAEAGNQATGDQGEQREGAAARAEITERSGAGSRNDGGSNSGSTKQGLGASRSTGAGAAATSSSPSTVGGASGRGSVAPAGREHDGSSASTSTTTPTTIGAGTSSTNATAAGAASGNGSKDATNAGPLGPKKSQRGSMKPGAEQSKKTASTRASNATTSGAAVAAAAQQKQQASLSRANSTPPGHSPPPDGSNRGSNGGGGGSRALPDYAVGNTATHNMGAGGPMIHIGAASAAIVHPTHTGQQWLVAELDPALHNLCRALTGRMRWLGSNP